MNGCQISEQIWRQCGDDLESLWIRQIAVYACRMSIRSRLFLLSLCAFGLIGALALYGLQSLNERNVRDYRSATLRLGASELAAVLAQEYEEGGGWSEVLRVAWRWPQMYPPLEQSRGRRGPLDRPPPPHRQRGAPPGDHRPQHTYQLFDQQGQRLSAGSLELSAAESLAIEHQGETIGFLGWQAESEDAHPLDAELQRRQQRAMLMTAVGALAGSALLAWGLASGFTRRIKRLAGATQSLAAGDWELKLSDDARDELGDLSRAFEQMAGALKQARLRERQWLIDIAHELRTPLSVLRGEIEAMQDGVRPVSGEQLASLRAEALHLGRLIDDLQALSSAESGQVKLHCQTINLRDFIIDITQAHQAQLEAAQLDVGVEMPKDLMLYADEQRLRQVIDNLLQNLCRYADAGAVRWSARRLADEVELELADSGPGVPAEQMPFLFDRLYRVDEARTRSQGGSGLGLAICRGIVEQHGGRIEAVASSLGGLAIRSYWPVA